MQKKDFLSYKPLYIKTASDNLAILQKKIPQLLNNSYAQDDIDEIHRTAHNLKTESIVMGYGSTSAACQNIEELFYNVKTGNLSLTNSLLQKVASAVVAIGQSLQEIEQHDQERDLSAIIADLQKP